jgi:hypothetical protein
MKSIHGILILVGLVVVAKENNLLGADARKFGMGMAMNRNIVSTANNNKATESCDSGLFTGTDSIVTMILPLFFMALLMTGGCCAVVYDLACKKMQVEINRLQVQLSGKTNSAFVFIKPHACKGNPGMVEAMVERCFTNAGIRITGKGEITAESIDRNMYIDTHYGAIASKAIKLLPTQLPDKGKAQFQEMFGESWDNAVAANKVFNAKMACEKLGVDAVALEAKWRQLTAGKNLIKFGGGFYCGKLDDIYVMNAFYMAMRAGK